MDQNNTYGPETREESLTREIEMEKVGKLIEAVKREHGYDLSLYSFSSLFRRVGRYCFTNGFSSIEALEREIVANKDSLVRFLQGITVNVTEMFRDPEFFKALRTIILPELAKEDHIRVWHAGCSTGEEVYSLAILMKEADLLEKTIFYGTDLDEEAVEAAKKGSFPLKEMQDHTRNYLSSGGTEEFSSYYEVRQGRAVFSRELGERMEFFVHDLVSDRSFNEFHLILCRNVLIYFDEMLQDRVLQMFLNSLSPEGYLGLGSRESILFSEAQKELAPVCMKNRIWNKKNP